MTNISELWVVVGAHSFSAFLMLVVGSFVLIQNWRKAENRLFFFLTISTFVFEFFFIVASLQTSYASAYFWWSFNILDVFITMSVVHFILRVSGRDTAWRPFLVLTYVLGFIILLVALVMPHWFLPDVVPRLYFAYYLDAGWWYVVMLTYFLLFPLMAASSLVRSFFESSGLARKRLEYFILMLVVGYGIGVTNFFLVFGILIDPIIGTLMGLYLLPIAYGIFATDLLDIRLAVRRGFYYAVAIGGITAFLSAISLLDPVLTSAIPGLQFWMLPLLVSVLALYVGRLVYVQFKESDRLKYEFMTVAAHKLRTPLTSIHWTIPELLELAGNNAQLKEGLLRIDDANNRLTELSDALLEVSRSAQVTVVKAPIDLLQLTNEALARFKPQIETKDVAITVDVSSALKALGDSAHVLSAIEVFIENAVAYTPAKGLIHITSRPDLRGVRYAVTDNGMGVAPQNRENIFSGFFRADAARIADTEGTGLGLSLAKNIIERLGGTIGFDSEGVGKGSTFWFVLPKA